MRSPVPSWRVSDAAAFDDLVATADALVAASSSAASAAEVRSRVLTADGFDRAAVREMDVPREASHALQEGSAVPANRDPEDILREKVLPAVFAGVDQVDTPRIVMLGGTPGAGRARAIARFQPDSTDRVAVVSPELLHTIAMSAGVDDGDGSAVVSTWLAACLRHARENRLSLLVDAPFRSPDVTLGALEGFRRRGFDPVLAVVATSPAEGLLAVTSARLRDKERVSTSFGELVDAEAATRNVLSATEGSDVPSRVVVVDRNGAARFDRDRETGFSGSTAAFDHAVGEPMSVLQATQWLSEVRRMTEFVSLPAVQRADGVPALVELHELALGSVVPRLPVAEGSGVAQLLQERLSRDLVLLQQMAPSLERRRETGPVVVPGPAGPGLSR